MTQTARSYNPAYHILFRSFSKWADFHNPLTLLNSKNRSHERLWRASKCRLQNHSIPILFLAFMTSLVLQTQHFRCHVFWLFSLWKKKALNMVPRWMKILYLIISLLVTFLWSPGVITDYWPNLWRHTTRLFGILWCEILAFEFKIPITILNHCWNRILKMSFNAISKCI